ncbi:hypothetical protein FGO68_gene1546 [Halteria grandinella]|uniref:Phospholipid-transporting ATPase n=1 Tax=Halteria grandinella TaxID=5974 RepID=A0A8J8P7G8_HALGN|nr:hypothetical protein FGO68_gene1546 [Halteria grandinella]
MHNNNANPTLLAKFQQKQDPSRFADYANQTGSLRPLMDEEDSEYFSSPQKNHYSQYCVNDETWGDHRQGPILDDIKEDMERGTNENEGSSFKAYQIKQDQENNTYRKEDLECSQVSLFSSSHANDQKGGPLDMIASSLKANIKLQERIQRAKSRGVAPPGKRIIHFNTQDSRAFLKRRNTKNTNRVRLTRYSLLSWAPLSLFYQFKRISNVYFLLITILTYMPFSPKSPQSMLGTFAMVLLFTMLKEAFEDYQRYKQQQDVNFNKHTHILPQLKTTQDPIHQFREVPWAKVKAGQLVQVRQDEEVPADMLLLRVSGERGMGYVDTMALDGETNLKEKHTILEDEEDQGLGLLRWFAGSLICDQPNDALEQWEGHLTLNDDKSKEVHVCSIKHMLLRGTMLKNTEWAVGVVIYTGVETKIYKNSKNPPHKTSNVMRLMNKMLATVFIFQLLIVFVCAGFNHKWAQETAPSHPETTGNTSQSFAIQVLTFWVAFSHMIPISLYVSIEILKLGLSMLINRDVAMCDSNQLATCRNSDLIEELGQVEIVFSDKTGTLTMNKMEFKKCQINGVRYGDAKRDEKNVAGMCRSGIESIENALLEGDQSVLNFFKALSICHSVQIQINAKGEKQYQASSPDELALVKGAMDIGIKFEERKHDRLTVHTPSEQFSFKVICEMAFDSTRKCMSVIVRDQEDQYFLYTKGADNVMLPKIDFAKSSENDQLEDLVQKDLYQYSCEGYRTLVFGFRRVSQKEYSTFSSLHSRLMQSFSDDKELQLSKLFAKMERKLRYLGCSAVEDKLQDGVPEAIANLMWAEIRFWVLTGDKLETAVEIARGCKIIENDTLTVALRPQSLDVKTIRSLFKQKEREIRSFLSRSKSSKSQNRPLKKQRLRVDANASLKDFQQEDVVVVIEGSVLAVILGHSELEDRFFQMTLSAKSVICCRVSPKQKADVVTMYRKRGKWVTLSVGDGANDVPMIMEASIGVGIRGREGTQAVRSGDYAIGQFRHLQNLLFNHGRNGYVRVSKMICSYFYKNIVLVFTELNFIVFTGFSGQLFFLEWLPMMYNAVFTSWQCLFAFMFERDVTPSQAIAQSQVYKIGQEGRMFNFRAFWREIVLAFWHGLVCFYVPMYGAGQGPQGETGLVREHWYYSTISFSVILHLVTYKLFVDSYFWNVLSITSGVIGIALYYMFGLVASGQGVSDLLGQPQLAGLMPEILGDNKFYIMVFFVPLICLLPDFTLHYFNSLFYPHLEQFIMDGAVKESKQEKKVRVEEVRKRLDEIVYRNAKSFLMQKVKETLKQNVPTEKNSTIKPMPEAQQPPVPNVIFSSQKALTNETDIKFHKKSALRKPSDHSETKSTTFKGDTESSKKSRNPFQGGETTRCSDAEVVETKRKINFDKYGGGKQAPYSPRLFESEKLYVTPLKSNLSIIMDEEQLPQKSPKSDLKSEKVGDQPVLQQNRIPNFSIPKLKLIPAEYAESSTNIEPETLDHDKAKCTDYSKPPARGNESDRWLTYRNQESKLQSPLSSVLPSPDSIRKYFEAMTRTPSVAEQEANPFVPTHEELVTQRLVKQIEGQKEIKTMDFLQSLIKPEVATTRVFMPQQMKREEILQRGHPLERVNHEQSTSAEDVSKKDSAGEQNASSNETTTKKRNRSLRSRSEKKYIKKVNEFSLVDRALINDDINHA